MRLDLITFLDSRPNSAPFYSLGQLHLRSCSFLSETFYSIAQNNGAEIFSDFSSSLEIHDSNFSNLQLQTPSATLLSSGYYNYQRVNRCSFSNITMREFDIVPAHPIQKVDFATIEHTTVAQSSDTINGLFFPVRASKQLSDAPLRMTLLRSPFA